MSDKRLPVRTIAKQIDAHLRRFEADPVINAWIDGKAGGLRPYYGAGALATGRFVSIFYIRYQGRSTLPRDEAEQYLAWLDAGNVGKHFHWRG